MWNLPSELLDSILDCLDGNEHTYVNISYVCIEWALVTRPRRFNRIVVLKEHEWHHLLDLLVDNESIRPLIHLLELGTPLEHFEETYRDMPVVTLFPNLTTLWIHRTRPCLDFVSCLPQLDFLRISRTALDWKDEGRSQRTSSLLIRHIKIDHDIHQITYLKWLRETQTLEQASLRKASLLYRYEKDKKFLLGVIHESFQLERLELLLSHSIAKYDESLTMGAILVPHFKLVLGVSRYTLNIIARILRETQWPTLQTLEIHIGSPWPTAAGMKMQALEPNDGTWRMEESLAHQLESITLRLVKIGNVSNIDALLNIFEPASRRGIVQVKTEASELIG